MSSVVRPASASLTDTSSDAASLANTIKNNAEKGSKQMDEMTAAVNEINEASGSINKVIKVIDEIAFQTNILALNAAVEAARAGQHGKGFAVVANEVRNLANKSSDSASQIEAKLNTICESSLAITKDIKDTVSLVNEQVVAADEIKMLVDKLVDVYHDLIDLIGCSNR